MQKIIFGGKKEVPKKQLNEDKQLNKVQGEIIPLKKTHKNILTKRLS